MEFTERGGLEDGFAPIFRARVRPALMALEDERLQRRATALRWTAGPVLVALVLGGFILFLFGGSEGSMWGAGIVVVIALVVSLAAWGLQRGAWTGAVAEAVMPAVCEHIGEMTYDKDASRGFPLGAMRQLGLIGNYDSATISDRLDGRHSGTGFTLVEARLTRKSRDSDGKTRTTTVFSGLMFRIKVPMPAPTPILIARDYGAIGNRLGSLFKGDKGRGMPRVEFDHPDFERVFEVHAENPLTARDFMPPGFLDILLKIAAREGGGRSRALVAGFEGADFYLALSRKGEFLKMGSLWTPVADMEDDLHAIFADIEIVHRIIDRLHGD